MIKLELDWAGDDAPELGTWGDERSVGGADVVVEAGDAVGAAGWPTIVVYVHDVEAGLPSYLQSMALDAWLKHAYGVEDEGEREDLASLAVDA